MASQAAWLALWGLACEPRKREEVVVSVVVEEQTETELLRRRLLKLRLLSQLRLDSGMAVMEEQLLSLSDSSLSVAVVVMVAMGVRGLHIACVKGVLYVGDER